MISEKTKKYFIRTVNKGNALKIYSYSFKNGEFHTGEAILVKWISIFSLIIISAFVLYFTVLALFISSSIELTLLIITGVSMMFICMGCQLWHLAHMDEICEIISQFFEFFTYLDKTCRAPKESGDAIEVVMQLTSFGISFLEVSLLPATVFTGFFTNTELTRLAWMPIYFMFESLEFTGTWLNFFCGAAGFIALFFGYLASIHGLYNIFMLVNVSIIYAGSTVKWMKYYSEKLAEDISAAEVENLRVLYTTHQVLHTMIDVTFPVIFEFAINAAIVLAVFSSYITIKFPADFVLKYIVSTVGALVYFCMPSALLSAIGCHICSKECCCIGTTRISLNRMYNQRFWKSRQTITMRIGHEFKLETKNYVLVVFGDIIVSNVINLLIGF